MYNDTAVYYMRFNASASYFAAWTNDICHKFKAGSHTNCYLCLKICKRQHVKLNITLHAWYLDINALVQLIGVYETPLRETIFQPSYPFIPVRKKPPLTVKITIT